ncbi:hypothetical protein [Xanthomonas arboricola]|uniref:hypothetical protein n=1 Tax=Xanthomonas arboricola TaxID=56448 RepID=UPI001620C193|nr:hypothetical protein [Xanthomonas arboricola]MBB3759565.1 hypothetical protein [Xanthomonas arboricola]
MSNDGKVYIQGQFALQPDKPIPLRVAVSIRYEMHDPESLEVEVLFLGGEEERAEAYRATQAIDINLVKLHPINEGEDCINLLGLTQWRSSFTRMTLEPSAIEIGIDRDAVTQPVNVSFIVGLQPSGILTGHGSAELHYNGNISMRHRDDGQILVQTALGPIEAVEAYDYLDGKAFGDKVVHRIQRVRLTGEFKLQPGETLRSLHDRLLEEIFPICSALSLCYRQPVDAYQIKYLWEGSEEDPIKRATYRRKWHRSRERTDDSELINTSSLREGGLSELVKALREHPRSKSLDQGIGFLSHSYVSFLETAYFTAFSAMETIVNAVSEDAEGMVIGSSSWRKVQKALRSSLMELADAGSISTETAKHMQEKLPELRRASLASRIDKVVDAYSIKISDLWTAEGFTEGMKRASGFRHDLFHAAHTSDIDLMGVDLIRIRAFTERLLLAALAWPEERRWAWRDDKIHWIIQPEDPEAGEER